MRLKLPMLAVFAFSLAASASLKNAEVKFEVKNDSVRFMKDVARLCLSTPESKIENLGSGQLKVTDWNAPCAHEIKSMASKWDQDPSTPTVAIHAKSGQKPALAKKITQKYQGTVTLDEGKSCPCLLLKGSKAQEAAEFARQ